MAFPGFTARVQKGNPALYFFNICGAFQTPIRVFQSNYTIRVIFIGSFFIGQCFVIAACILDEITSVIVRSFVFDNSALMRGIWIFPERIFLLLIVNVQ